MRTQAFRMRPLALLMAAALLAAPAYAGPAEDKLMSCMRANIPKTLRIQEFDLTATDRAGASRLLRGKLFAKREDEKLKSMLRLVAPADVSGASYLLLEGDKADQMYVYLPALNKVRRINGASSDGPLFGTDLSYADIKQVNNAFSGSAPTLEASEKIDGRAVKRISVVPHAETGSRYSRIRAWVDEASCVAIKAEFLEGETVRKRLLSPAASLTKSGAYWYAAEATMSDLKEGSHTTLKVTGVKSGEEVANRYFDSRNFYVGN